MRPRAFRLVRRREGINAPAGDRRRCSGSGAERSDAGATVHAERCEEERGERAGRRPPHEARPDQKKRQRRSRATGAAIVWSSRRPPPSKLPPRVGAAPPPPRFAVTGEGAWASGRWPPRFASARSRGVCTHVDGVGGLPESTSPLWARRPAVISGRRGGVVAEAETEREREREGGRRGELARDSKLMAA